MHSTGTGQPVETQDVFFCHLAGRSAPTGLANCPLDRVLIYKNFIYLLNLQFVHAAPTLWNNLPVSIRSSNSLLDFRRQLKTYFFTLAYNIYYLDPTYNA